MIERDYKEDVKIDANNLEKEWVEQPSVYMYYAEAHAEAMRIRDERKQKLEILHAELSDKYRSKWERFSDAKMTEGGITAKILSDPYYIKAQKILNNANHRVNVLNAAKTAFDHRKKALENLVTLLVTGFHSEPRIRKVNKGTQTDGGHTEHKKKINQNRRRKTRKS